MNEVFNTFLLNTLGQWFVFIVSTALVLGMLWKLLLQPQLRRNETRKEARRKLLAIRTLANDIRLKRRGRGCASLVDELEKYMQDTGLTTADLIDSPVDELRQLRDVDRLVVEWSPETRNQSGTRPKFPFTGEGLPLAPMETPIIISVADATAQQQK